jgi:hypothetical protein
MAQHGKRAGKASFVQSPECRSGRNVAGDGTCQAM